MTSIKPFALLYPNRDGDYGLPFQCSYFEHGKKKQRNKSLQNINSEDRVNWNLKLTCVSQETVFGSCSRVSLADSCGGRTCWFSGDGLSF